MSRERQYINTVADPLVSLWFSRSMKPNTGLLVSVRSVAEAGAALDGGAAIIDVKEPRHGSLGRADDEIIQAVVRAVGQARPVSAALGEWTDNADAMPVADLSYVKWGLAGCQRHGDWRAGLLQVHAKQIRPQVVFVAYADWQCAQAPPVDEVFALAAIRPGSVLLVDTHCKEAKLGKHRPTLLDWLNVASIDDLCVRCRATGVRLALAGSLGEQEIQSLLGVRPDWFAVRGAVCDGDRDATVQADKVRSLVQLLATGDRSLSSRR